MKFFWNYIAAFRWRYVVLLLYSKANGYNKIWSLFEFYKRLFMSNICCTLWPVDYAQCVIRKIPFGHRLLFFFLVHSKKSDFFFFLFPKKKRLSAILKFWRVLFCFHARLSFSPCTVSCAPPINWYQVICFVAFIGSRIQRSKSIECVDVGFSVSLAI